MFTRSDSITDSTPTNSAHSNRNDVLYKYFLLSTSDINLISKFYEENLERKEFHLNEFLGYLGLSENKINTFLVSTIILKYSKPCFIQFTRFILYFALLDELSILEKILQLISFIQPDKSLSDCMEEYLGYLMDQILTQNDKLNILQQYLEYKFDLKSVLSIYKFRHTIPPIFIPIIDIKNSIYEKILPQHRCKELIYLRQNYEYVSTYKTTHNNKPPFTICQYIHFLFTSRDPYSYDFSLPIETFNQFSTPSFLPSQYIIQKLAYNNKMSQSKHTIDFQTKYHSASRSILVDSSKMNCHHVSRSHLHKVSSKIKEKSDSSFLPLS